MRTFYHFIIYTTISLSVVILSKIIINENYPQVFESYHSESNHLKENKSEEGNHSQQHKSESCEDASNFGENSNKNVRILWKKTLTFSNRNSIEKLGCSSKHYEITHFH